MNLKNSNIGFFSGEVNSGFESNVGNLINIKITSNSTFAHVKLFIGLQITAWMLLSETD
jgi:hypothetical protein